MGEHNAHCQGYKVSSDDETKCRETGINSDHKDTSEDAINRKVLVKHSAGIVSNWKLIHGPGNLDVVVIFV